MENKEELIISAINELKDEQKETRKEISTMNKALASLASYHQRLNNLEVAATMMACAIYKLPMIEHETFYNLVGDIMDNFNDHGSIQEVQTNRFCKLRSFL